MQEAGETPGSSRYMEVWEPFLRLHGEARPSDPFLNLYYKADTGSLNPHLEFSRAASRKVTLKHPRVEKQRGLKVACAKVRVRANSSPNKSPCPVSPFPTRVHIKAADPCSAQVTP